MSQPYELVIGLASAVLLKTVRSYGFVSTGFIQNLIKTGHRLKAIDYIYSFDMVHKFQPVSAIINDFLRITKESAEKSFRDAKNEYAPKVKSPSFLCSQLLLAIKLKNRFYRLQP